MKIEPFAMERFQSIWENVVDYNLSESGIHPLQLYEILTKEDLKDLAFTSLGYNQTNGSAELRATIADLYRGASGENILVTTGSAEANFLSIWCLIEPGDALALMLPNYMQIWGLANAFGAKVKSFHLIPNDGRWQIDWDELEKSVTPSTKLIAICNPNNPTGAQLKLDEMNRICDMATKTNAWILSDEVYRGAERIGDITSTFWRQYDKVIAVGGLSKAYGLPGLRIGWVVAPPDLVEKLWSYHDYTTICPNPLSDRLAKIALSSPNREKILERTQKIVRTNFKILENWMNSHDGLFECIPPIAGAIALAKYNLNITSLELVTRLRKEKSVLVVPGEHFFMENYLRFGFGGPSDYLQKALNRISQLISEIQ
ncbi:MAG: aminotransferase class I/II-fold pyridoxal phosphate-dependent enzyme [bacterium]|nr:MAG: aminotransferase class I/II-fold pyridoxal phosphate-dependent enzyme [bacterium]